MAPQSSGGYRFERLSVMVIDDNPHMLDLISEVLRGLSIRRVIRLTDAAEAFKQMMSETVDLIILNHVMDSLNGIEFARLVRSGEDSPDTFVPIIMVTGYGDAATVRAARDAGVNEFLAKPISARGLYARILEVIDKARPFIRCPDYFGPDRRRQDAPFEGEDRRTTAPAESPEGDGPQLIPAVERG
jgi:two-component system chemotaxis response regulator CheY